MASFFQPAVYNGGIGSLSATTNSSATSSGRFQVYTNPILARNVLLANWYQFLVLGLGIAAVAVPVLRWVFGGIWNAVRWRRKAKYGRLKDFAAEDIPDELEPPHTWQGDSQHQVGHPAPVTTFGMFLRGNLVDFLAIDYDLHIIDLDTCAKGLPGMRRFSVDPNMTDAVSTHPAPSRNIWALIDEADWNAIVSTHPTLLQMVDRFKSLKGPTISGVILSSKIQPTSTLNELLHLLVEAGIPAMLLEDATEPCAKIASGLLCGVIYKNACILSNGFRRDFFQASELRSSLARYEQESKVQSNFFTGFMDLWMEKPLPSTIRRSYKFAKFNGAVLHHEAAGGVCLQIDADTADWGNAMGAFDWLKRDDIVQAQASWRNAVKPTEVDISTSFDRRDFDLSEVEKIIPNIQQYFVLRPVAEQPSLMPEVETGRFEAPMYVGRAPPRTDFWTTSSQGETLCEAGCFDIREELFDEQYDAVVETQKHLLRLKMLEDLTEKDLKLLCTSIQHASITSSSSRRLLLELSAGLLSKQIKIYRGMDSGFCLPESRGHFWAVSNGEDGELNIFVSLKVPDFVTTVAHTYLAHRGVNRRSRFDIEAFLLPAHDGIKTLHPRIAHELDNSTYAELLHMLEQITVFGEDDPILDAVQSRCEYLLVDETSNRAWNELHSQGFLSKSINIEHVLQTRLKYFAKRGSRFLPDLEGICYAYRQIDDAIKSALYESSEERLAILSGPVWRKSEANGNFDDVADLYTLLFFCSLRRLAYDEVYMETTDRCPLFLQQHDQAAVFAELWVLGSSCEKYFGIKPRALGAIIYDEYRDYLHAHPPSNESWNGTDVFTAYHKVKLEDLDEQVPVGSDMKQNGTAPSAFRARFAKATFLTIFCVPAIVDVVLLTFLGRGLYLTAFMTLEERIMANYAVLGSLVMTAGVTGWSGSTGGFYLYQSAFHNMNHFMVQRLAGGFMIAALFAVCGFIAFSIQFSPYAGVLFAAYLIVLSTYLNLLGIMATMHRDGAPFKSGRTALAQCLLITLISPILSSLVNGHDVLIYLLVLYAFLATLLFSYTRLCHEWSSWPELIPIVKEEDIIKAYEEQAQGRTNPSEKPVLFTGEEKPRAESQKPPSYLTRFGRKLAMKKTDPGDADKFFAKLAKAHKYVVWLLEKESNGAPLPKPYSTTWLVQTKLALTNQQQINRGLKEHSPFLLFRNAKYDLAQNTGLFLVALLDRWVAVSMSANGVVVNIYYNSRARYGVAFGLLYFLVCAVSLDVVLQRYWGKTGRRSNEKLANIFDFEMSEAAETAIEKKRWFTAVLELTWVMTFVFGVMTILLWLFVSELNQLVLYFCYIVAYSGVIIFQFNRVFTTDIRKHVQIVFVAAAFGYVVGVVLHEIPATKGFRFNDVIAINCASISAAIGTWLYTDFCDDPSQEVHIENEDLVNWKVYSQKLLGHSGNCNMRAERLEEMRGIECQFDDNSVLSEGIKTILAQALSQRNTPIHSTFAKAQEMIEFTQRLWKRDQLRLFVVDRKNLSEAGGSHVFAASTKVGDVLMVYIGMPSMDSWRNISYASYETLLVQLAAEAMLHECCEGMMGLRHADATLAELLLNSTSDVSTRMAVQLAWANQAELAAIVSCTNTELLRHLCISIDPSTSWETTHEDTRSAIVSRILGRSYPKNESLRELMHARSQTITLHDWYIKQCLGVRETALARMNSDGNKEIIESGWSFRERAWANPLASRQIKGFQEHLDKTFQEVYEVLFMFIQFIAIVSTAGTDCGRELWYILRNFPLRSPILWTVMKVWKVCYWVKNLFVRCIIYQNDSHYKHFREWTFKGASRTLGKGILNISDPRYEKTGFVASAMNGIELAIYQGTHQDLPTKRQDHQIASYDASLRIVRLAYIQIEATNIEYNYYQWDSDNKQRKYPTARITHLNELELPSFYDEFGRITNGECLRDGQIYSFVYDYKLKPKNNSNILKALYANKDIRNPIVYEIYWCRASDDSSDNVQTWTPTGRVARYVRTTNDYIEEINFTYEHKLDPVITRIVYSSTGQQLKEEETLDKFKDEFNFLPKPTDTQFEDEDLLFYHSKSSIRHAANTSPRNRRPSTPHLARDVSGWAKFRGKKQFVERHKLTTADLRTALWKTWATRTDMTAITACHLDEMMLRNNAQLNKYWQLRDAGHFLKAKEYLKKNLVEIVAATEVADHASAKVSLAIRPSDLFVMGVAKDANYVVAEPEERYIDTDTRVGVIFTDTGCWPDAPGGVSNCRRDLVDGHSTVRNYALTESANEFGIPRFQLEKNLQLVKNLPLWGLDGKNPCHGLFDNLLQTQVEHRIRRTRKQEDIVQTFIPLLRSIVRGARTRKLSQKDLSELTSVFMNLNRYFDENDYLTTWRSKPVKKAWREAWLTEYADSNISNPNDSFSIERPTGSDFDEALELWISYFFVFSIRVPDEVPRVYQSTHHGISSLYGMILKLRRGTTWGIWDHAIMWRESCLNISPAQCILPISVQTMLLGAMKLAANLAYTHADVILPCTAIYNPIWEAELGTDQSRRGSPKLFERKIDPITNGISNMDKFKPVQVTRTEDPTVIMLSNVQFIKDVKNAIYAADVIINDFGFKTYNLVVYGAQDRQPSYAIETAEMIVQMGIQDTVKLGGFGSPNEVLKDAWLFMNSSLSEGLPLAIGEAALSGIPIVATEVGATAQVLTDADDPSILYGEVVPPNDPVALARAQLQLLAMIGPWAKYTKDESPPPPLPSKFSPHDVEWITQRMHDKAADRRALGLKLRDVVLRKFNGGRYLREHEQMFWIQRHMSDQRADERLSFLTASHPKFGQPLTTRLVEVEDPESIWLEDRWQDFNKPSRRRQRDREIRRVAESFDEEEAMLGDDDDIRPQ